jgi:crossover junction endodeoxyribonuclease RuvC
MLILGLDPGSSSTGYGVIECRPGRLRAVDYGTLSPPRGLPFLRRLPYITDALERLADRMRPDAVAAEDVFVSRNLRVALKLGHVRGAALLPLLRAGIPVHEYPARLVKKAVTGYGAADKDQVRRMVRVLLALQAADLALDTSDALAVAICHAHARPLLARHVVCPV